MGKDRKARVIILGCGYLGYNLYNLLADRFHTELWGIESPYSSLVKAMKRINVFDEAAMRQEDLQDAVIIDAVGLIANNARAEQEEETIEARVRAPYRSLMNALNGKNIRQFIFFSSGGTIYGNTEQPIRESDPIAPMSLYARSKAAAEKLVSESSVPYLILRLSNPYGGYQVAEKKQGVIPILIRKALKDEPFEMFVSPDSVRDYFYITDLGNAIAGLAESRAVNEIVNIGSGQGTSLTEIIHKVEEATGKQIEVHRTHAEVPTVQSIVLNIEKANALCGYVPEVSLAEGIRRETARIREEMGL